MVKSCPSPGHDEPSFVPDVMPIKDVLAYPQPSRQIWLIGTKWTFLRPADNEVPTRWTMQSQNWTMKDLRRD